MESSNRTDSHEPEFYDAEDVCRILNCKRTYAYNVIRDMNKEMQAKGFRIIRGKINSQYFKEQYYLNN